MLCYNTAIVIIDLVLVLVLGLECLVLVLVLEGQVLVNITVVCNSINRPGDLDFRPFDHKFTGYSCDGLPSRHRNIFGLPKPFRSQVRSSHATDRQTDDRQTPPIIS